MEYFIVEQDRRLMGGAISFPERIMKGFEYAEQNEVVYVKAEGDFEYSCIIDRPVLLVSDEFKRVICEFDPQMEYKAVVVMDLERQLQFPYFIMNLRDVSCNSRHDSFPGAGRIDDLVIDEKQINEQAIFKITYYRSSYLVVRLDVAEHLLRKSLYGLKLKRIHSIEGDNYECTS
ncbi:hypothetical protein D1872_191890 [compost metagenome]